MIKQRITKIDRYREASGVKATFDSKAAYAVVGAEFDIEGYYAGTGEPSPSNPWSLLGNTNADIIQSGEDTSVYTTTNVSWLASGNDVYIGKLDLVRGKVIATHLVDDLGSRSWITGSGGAISRFVCSPSEPAKRPAAATDPSGAISDIFKQATSREIYDGQDMSIGIHTSGVIWVSDTDYDDPAEFKTAMIGHYVAYELATPLEISITPVILKQLTGVNNIWIHNNGDSYIKYRV